MATLGYTHITTEYKDESSCIPKGKYPVQVIKSELLPTKDKTGEYVKIQLQVIEGPQENRIAFLQFTVEHHNQDAQRIGRAQLNQIVKAVGLDMLTDTEELHGKPFIATLGEKDEGKGYPPKNVLNGAAPYSRASNSGAHKVSAPAHHHITESNVESAVQTRRGSTNGKRSTPF